MIPARRLEHASTQPASTAAARRFRTPDQLLAFDDGRLEIITIGGEVVAKGVYAPGWRWSRCAPRPLIAWRGSASHVGLVLSGRAGLQLEEDRWIELVEGDLFHASMTPHYDLWVVGPRPCEVLYLNGVDAIVRRLRGPV